MNIVSFEQLFPRTILLFVVIISAIPPAPAPTQWPRAYNPDYFSFCSGVLGARLIVHLPSRVQVRVPKSKLFGDVDDEKHEPLTDKHGQLIESTNGGPDDVVDENADDGVATGHTSKRLAALKSTPNDKIALLPGKGQLECCWPSRAIRRNTWTIYYQHPADDLPESCLKHLIKQSQTKVWGGRRDNLTEEQAFEMCLEWAWEKHIFLTADVAGYPFDDVRAAGSGASWSSGLAAASTAASSSSGAPGASSAASSSSVVAAASLAASSSSASSVAPALAGAAAGNSTASVAASSVAPALAGAAAGNSDDEDDDDDDDSSSSSSGGTASS